MKWQYALLSLAVSFLGVNELRALAQSVSSTVVTTAASAVLTASEYRWYANQDALTPTTALAVQDTATTTPAIGSALRIRTSIRSDDLSLGAGATFLLQYANATSGPWTNLSTGTAWIFVDNPGVADGQIIVTTVLSSSDVGESYGESNPSAASPNTILAGQEGEWDWALYNNSATSTSDWFFRMILSSGTVLDAYSVYPHLTAAVTPPPPPPPPPGGGGGGYIPGATPQPGATTTATSGLKVVVGPLPPTPCDSPFIARVDLSGDCRVDMTDLSILVYYYNRTGEGVERYDFSENGRVDLFDVSVMMFYWTD